MKTNIIVFVIVFVLGIFAWRFIAHTLEKQSELEKRIHDRDSVINVWQHRFDSLDKVKSRIDTAISVQETKTQKIITTREIVTQGLRYIPADSLVQVFKLQLDSAGRM